MAHRTKFMYLIWLLIGHSGLNAIHAQTTAESNQDVSLDSLFERVDPHRPQKLQSLLIRTDVQEELEIGRDSYSVISQAQADIRKAELELRRARPDFSDRQAFVEHLREVQQLQQERKQLTADAIAEFLPPEPYQRLKQIAYWIQIAESGLSNVLLFGPLSEELDFTDAEWRRLVEKADELEAEKQAKIDKIVAEYDGRLLQTLKKRQREKLERLLGDPFEYEVPDYERSYFERVRQSLEQVRGLAPKEKP